MDAALGDCIRRLAGRKEPAPLVPKKIWDPELEATIERLLPDTEPLKSALHLWNDNLNRAHEIAQEIGTATGSYLHGLMHRREPDYGNSRYWFRRVGEHPHFPGVRLAALELLSGRFSELSDIRAAVENSGSWDAFRMVDWCQEAEGREDLLAHFLRSLQSRELGLLVDGCGRRPRG
jgi:hypothetical protein